MKIKYNFSLLKNKDVGFIFEDKKYHGILLDVKKINTIYRFIYENNYIEIKQSLLDNYRINKDNDIIWLEYFNEPILSGLVVFTMYDTYGFPMEITKEIMQEKNIKIDEKGYFILKELQKQKSQDSFKNKNAF